MPSNRSPPCWSTQMTHPFDRCSFYVFPFAPPFFPLSQFPRRQLVIVENRCEILPTKLSPLFLFFFLSNLKSRILTLGSLNFASFYKSFISTFLFFFNFKFLILLPFDGGRTELECFEKFKFSFASLFSFEVRLSKLRHLD